MNSSNNSEELGNMVMKKGVRESPNPPPFLTKTREMVEDPTTNSIISWNSTGTSFIIWDHLIFSKDILPQYFKHNNFSSFIYQLNNYGFKKIGLRQYEYENKWFKRGKEHLVINITRRNGNPSSVTTTRGPRKRPFFDTLQLITQNQMKADLDILRSNVCKMKSELGSLKDEIQDIQIQMIQFQQKIRQTETQTPKILDFLAQTCSPSFAQQITKLVEEELEDDQAIMEELTRLLVPRQKDEIPSKNMCNLDLKTQDEELGGDSAEDFDARIFWKEVLKMAEEDFFVCDNEGVVQVNPGAGQQSKINQLEFDNLLDSKMVEQVEDAMEDEVVFELGDSFLI